MENILEVKHLQTSFLKYKELTHYTSDVTFEVKIGETVGIVGESGCGKSITALSLMQLLAKNGRITKGSILFDGKELLDLSEKEMDKIRGNEMSMIFQDTMSSLNPVFTIGNQITEAIKLHGDTDNKTARLKAIEMLRKVGLLRPEKIMKEYSFMLSGGMRQRAMIAMALSCTPKLLIADEPTTALDVTIQAQIVKLMKELKDEYNMAIMLITHDMGLVAEMADRVIVMYAGEIVEMSDVYDLFEHPKHPYTKALLESIPSVEDSAERKLFSIPGTVPDNYQNLTGCRFYDRCNKAFDKCRQHPVLEEISQGHCVRCYAAWEEKLLNG